MAKVRSGVSLAGITGTMPIQGRLVVCILRLFDDYLSGRREEVAVPGVTRRKNTIHHVDSMGNIMGEFLRHAYTHYISRTVPRQEWCREGCDLLAQRPW